MQIKRILVVFLDIIVILPLSTYLNLTQKLSSGIPFEILQLPFFALLS